MKKIILNISDDGQKSYECAITQNNKNEDFVFIECEEAGISQNFLIEDVGALLLDMSNLI